jgi:Carboxypeptidase regulatory-like domain
MRKAQFFLYVASCGVFLLLMATGVSAQFKASVQGTVTDTSGAVVPNATVTLANKETNQSRSTTTSDGGFYRFSELPPGTYTLTTEKENFKKQVIDDVKVEAEALTGVNVQLAAGVISEVVTITGEAAPLETEDANVKKNISTEEVLRLPQTGRDPYQLARLTPGVFGDGARAANGTSANLPNTSGPGGSNLGIFATENQVQITANGQRLSANNFEVDGTSVNSQTWGGAAVITPSQESVKEVLVTSSTYSAEDGRNSGAQIKVVTQNGTNQFHGSGFFKWNDPRLNSFNKMPLTIGTLTTQGPTRVEEKSKTFGGSIGGPIIHNRLFFWFSYEGLRTSSNNTKNTFVDTSQLRQTIISARPNTLTARILSTPGIEPRVVQVLNVNCAAAATLGLSVPCQDVTGGLDIGSPGGTYGTYLQSTNPQGGGFDGIPDLQYATIVLPKTFRGHQFFSRIDYNLTDKDRLAFSSTFTPVTQIISDDSAQSRPQADITSKRLNYQIGFIYGRNISASMVNEARFNITRWGYKELTNNAGFELPRIEIEGTFSDRLRYGQQYGLNTPGNIDEKQLDFRDVLNKVIGNSSWKFGGEYRLDLNHNGELGGARPLYSFFRPWNFANGTPIFEQYTANPDGKPIANDVPFRTGDLAFFVQDDWKFRPNVTFNLGLRWEYFSPITATGGRVIGNLILDSAGGLAGAKISTAKQLTNKDLNNFGPQLGFAWSPTTFFGRPRFLGGELRDKFVLRGGAGIGYDRLPNALLANARRNPPNGSIYGICCGISGIPPDDWSTPFVGGQITYVASSDNTIFGYPANPLIGGGANPTNGLPNLGQVEIYGSPRDLPNAYTYRYSLEGEYELPAKIVASLGYQGSAGRHFVRIVPEHIVAPSSNPNIRAAYFASPDTNTNYNAMIANVRSRFNNGVQFNINYRWAKSIDNTSYEAPCACTNQSYPIDQKQERGPSDFDVRHSFNASALWDLPFLRNKRSLKGKLLGGWQINSIVTAHGGFPWTPRIFGGLNTTISGFGDIRPTQFFGNQPLSNTNANFLSPGGIFPGGGSAYFSTTTNGSNPLLNPPGIGRNVFRGPRYFDVDMAFAKRFGLTESSSVDVRFNFFNIFNHLNLAPFVFPSDNVRVNLGAFGTATQALAGRTGEFQVRFNF